MDQVLYSAILIYCVAGTINHLAHLWKLKEDEVMKENCRVYRENIKSLEAGKDRRRAYIQHLEAMLAKKIEKEADS